MMIKVSQNAPSFIMFPEIYQTEKKVIFTLTEPFASEYLTVTLTVHLHYNYVYKQRFVGPILLAVINCHRFCREYLRQQLTIRESKEKSVAKHRFYHDCHDFSSVELLKILRPQKTILQIHELSGLF